MNRLFLTLACSALLTNALAAQTLTQLFERPRVGVFANVSYDLHSASFTQLPGVPNCCPEFTGGTGLGFFGGLTYVAPLDRDLFLDLRAHYASYGVDMSETQTLPVMLSTGTETNATIAYDLSASFAQIGIEPMVGYRVTPEIALRGGIMAGFVLGGTFDQKETLVDPPNATFETGQRTRNVVTDADIENVASFAFGITVGASYDLPLNTDGTMFLSPEVLLTYRPLNLVSDVDWKVMHLRAGLALTFIPPDVSDSLDAYELYDVARRTPLPQRGAPGVRFVPDITATGVTEDGRTTGGQATVRIEEFASTRVRPLLPYVFFDERSADVPDRYRPLNQDQVDVYSLDNFYNLDAMVTYRQLLNIVGVRMRDAESTTITLTGCTDGTEDASGDLARRRAEAVKSYLVSTWSIAPSRIAIETRGLPETPSNPAEVDGRAENRRVEISSTDRTILAPVTSQDTMRVFEPTGIRFMPSIDPKVPIANWTVFVSENERIIRTFHGNEPMPASMDWRMAEQDASIPRGTRNLEYMLVVQDSAGTVVPSDMKLLPVSEVTLADKQRSGGTDKTIDRYSMILFAFDKADLSTENAGIVAGIRNKIGPTSQVRITGYTDRSGADDYNQRLSEQRARAVANALGASNATVSGLGERLPLYDNSTPEGRFYSRTVEVIVETPRK
jgi:outer membrane protein OmpA-like peptidoglycan-associated protein